MVPHLSYAFWHILFKRQPLADNATMDPLIPSSHGAVATLTLGA